MLVGRRTETKGAEVGRARSLLAGFAGVAVLMAIVRPIFGALRQNSAEDIGRWRTLTIDRPIEEISPGGEMPAALAALGSNIEIDIHSAPGNWGTEVAVRWVGPKKAADGDDPRVVVRRALQEVKQLAEVGEVLQGQPRSEGKRPATPTGRMVDRAEKNSGKGAVL
jgi:hypothetical protein